MTRKYTSLSELSKRSQIYETMPVRMTENLKRSVLISVIAGTISTGGLLLISNIPLGTPTNDIWGFTVKLGNGVLSIGHGIAPLMIALNVICVILMIGIFIVSWGMTNEVREPIHWIAGVGSVPPIVTTTSTGIVVLMLVAVLVLQIIISILAGIFVLMLFAGFINSLGS
jgi:hypothetical protein